MLWPGMFKKERPDNKKESRRGGDVSCLAKQACDKFKPVTATLSKSINVV